MNRIAIATRFHTAGGTTPAPKLESINVFLSMCEKLSAAYVSGSDSESTSTLVLIACDEEADKVVRPAVSGVPNVICIVVKPWTAFTPAWNALVSRSASDGCNHVLFMSAETSLSAGDLSLLVSHSDPSTLVCGAVLPGHDYKPGTTQVLNGRTCPWNTCALWNLSYLSLLGFPLVADGLLSDVPAGVEEVSTVSILQTLRPILKAKLIPVASISWLTSFDDPERAAWHERKMKSKVSRPEAQLSKLYDSSPPAALPGPGNVIHVEVSQKISS